MPPKYEGPAIENGGVEGSGLTYKERIRLVETRSVNLHDSLRFYKAPLSEKITVIFRIDTPSSN